jgi:sulfur carrier protein ThiS adenylyltransferase
MNIFEQGLRRYLTADQIEALGQRRIGIAGAGGIGSNAALCLVRTGIVRLRLVDFDAVEPSNLNRQFYFMDQIGMLKVDALKSNLQRINPSVSIETTNERIDCGNVQRLFRDCDIIVEALDRPEEKSMLVSSMVSKGIPVVAVSGIAGWGDSDMIRTRRFKSGCVLIGDERSDIAVLPPLAPRVMVAAAKVADEVISCILG